MIWNIAGYDVILDEEDYERLKRYTYYIDGTLVKKYRLFYFKRNIYVNGKYTGTRLHRDIMGCVYGDGKVVDHISGNTLDCRKANLRICSFAENRRNNKISCNNSSGIKGVYWNNAHNKWRAQINLNGKNIHLGYFTDIEDATKAYADASEKYHGEFRRLK